MPRSHKTAAKESPHKKRNAPPHRKHSAAPPKADKRRTARTAAAYDVPDSLDMPVYGHFPDLFGQPSLPRRKGKGRELNSHRSAKDEKRSRKIELKAKKDPPHCVLMLRSHKLNLLTQVVGDYQAAKKVLNLEKNIESSSSESSDSESEDNYVEEKRPAFMPRKSGWAHLDGINDDFGIDDDDDDDDSENISIEDLESLDISDEDSDLSVELDTISTESEEDSVSEIDDIEGNDVAKPKSLQNLIEQDDFSNHTGIESPDRVNSKTTEYELEQPQNPCEDYLISLGFSFIDAKKAAQSNGNDIVEALSDLIEKEIINMGERKHIPSNATLAEAKKTRMEEKKFLNAVYNADFQESSDDHWIVFITPSYTIQESSPKAKVALVVDVKFRKYTCYPYEPPVITVTERNHNQSLSILTKYKLMLELNHRASVAVGKPMVKTLVDWLTTPEADSIVKSQMQGNQNVASSSLKANSDSLILKGKNISVGNQNSSRPSDMDQLASKMKTLNLSNPGSTFIRAIGNESIIENNVVAHLKTPNLKPKRNEKKEDLDLLSKKMLQDFRKSQNSTEYIEMQSVRQALPAWEKRFEIVDSTRNNQVVVVSGETGCGKTTQVPQFILDNYIENSKGSQCKILVTQPRRISAIGVAQRVAAERGEPLGTTVGYQIRLESVMSEKTRILFCTTGILLRRLEGRGSEDNGSWGEGIGDVSHVIVDEVHERSLESDFLLMVLRDLLEIRTDLTLILMSATLNAELFCSYFSRSETNTVPRIHIMGRTFPVTPIFLEDAIHQTNYMPAGDYLKKNRRKNNPDSEDQGNPNTPDELLTLENLQTRYSHLPRAIPQALFTMDHEKIQHPLILLLILQRVSKMLKRDFPDSAQPPPSPNPKGSSKSQPKRKKSIKNDVSMAEEPNRGILVFLPGFDEISLLHDAILNNSHLRAATGDGAFCIPLHSTLTSTEQTRVFNRPPPGVVKIIIATNIAETSITVDDVVFVVDSGRVKEMRFDAVRGMASLTDCWVAQASALQRRGRAGRVAEGECVHLVTRHRLENVMDVQQIPEIKRMPLEQICLRIKVLPFLKGEIGRVLGRVIEPPEKFAVAAAVETLRTMRALTVTEELTPLGFHLGRLPVDVRIGKFILFGSIFHCLDPVLTIAAAMSIKSPFVSPFDKRDIADEKKREFTTGLSDHLTILTAYNDWIEMRRKGRRDERLFCSDKFLSGKTLSMMASVKRQLAELVSDIGFIPPVKARDMERRGGWYSDGVSEAVRNKNGVDRHDNWELIKAVMIAALYPHVIRMDQPEPTRKGKRAQMPKWRLIDGEEVAIHPSSVNSQVREYPSPFAVYLDKIKTKRVYIRDVTSVTPYALAFFGGPLNFDRLRQELHMGTARSGGNKAIRFGCKANSAAVICSARIAFDELLAEKIENPELDISTSSLVDVIVDLVTN
ncbi:ATPdependent RNA helicase [Nowakowskiella sp. JEL0078]|nr:ATPdependent RNA helicase [Nowakowskiella sp. JEL0078]